jgi:peptide/nickel transport system substrate-binding protein
VAEEEMMRYRPTFLVFGLVAALFWVLAACGGADDEEAVAVPTAAPPPAAPAPTIDTEALAQAVEQAVQRAVPAAVQQATPAGPSAEEISRMVQTAIAAAAPETATPAEIQKMVEDAVAAAAQPGATKEEIGDLVAQAVSESVADIQPGVSAQEVQKIVSDSLKAATLAPAPTAVMAPTPAMMVKTGGTLRHFPTASIPNLDLVWQASGVSQSIGRNFYDFPFGWDHRLEPGPQMVDTWSITVDAKQYTFTLRDGLQFHNGDPVKAEDVVATILRWKESVFVPGKIWALAEPTVEVVDDKGFKIKPTKPFALWLNYWGQWPTYVMPKALADSLEKEVINTDYTGSGPFRLVSWTPGNKVTQERYDPYVSRTNPKSGTTGARIAYFDFLEHIEVPDAATKLAALETGQGDIADGLPNDFYDTLLKTKGLVTEIILRGQRPELGTNKLWPPLNSPKARLAIQMMTDQEAYLRAAYGPEELWLAESCLFFCESQWESYVGDDAYHAKPNLEAAKKLWDEAVAETGFQGKMVLLTAPDYAEFYASALLTKDILEKLGAEVDFVATDWATVVGRKIANLQKNPQTEQGWHFYHTASPPFDPLSYQGMSDKWNGGWDNPAAQQLIKDFSNASSVKEAKEIVDELHRIWYYEDPGTIVYGSTHRLLTMQDYVKGYVPHRTMYFDGLWFEK